MKIFTQSKDVLSQNTNEDIAVALVKTQAHTGGNSETGVHQIKLLLQSMILSLNFAVFFYKTFPFTSVLLIHKQPDCTDFPLFQSEVGQKLFEHNGDEHVLIFQS